MDFDPDDDVDNIASTAPEDTACEWTRLLSWCAREKSVGCGLLGSFLSGPDIDRRTRLVCDEAARNRWLRLELRDTVADDGASWPRDCYEQLAAAAAPADERD